MLRCSAWKTAAMQILLSCCRMRSVVHNYLRSLFELSGAVLAVVVIQKWARGRKHRTFEAKLKYTDDLATWQMENDPAWGTHGY